MDRRETMSFISPKDVDEETSKKVLNFLNSVKNPQEIADTVEFEGRDVGINVAEHIAAKREELGSFKSLDEVASIQTIGPKRFTDIVTAVSGATKVEPERLNFSALQLKNINYFGNISGTELKPVLVKKIDTSYEDLKCVGYNPQFKRLEAIVHINREYGYGSGLCGAGTEEYVRFYVDWDNNGTWADLGVASFTAHNISGKKPLEYAVTLKISPKEKYCKIENLPKVRAILEWNRVPDPNTPNYIPVWGNVKDAYIQIGKALTLSIKDMIDANVIAAKLDAVKPFVDVDQLLEAKQVVLSHAQLAEIYKGKVDPSRFAFPLVHKMISNPNINENMLMLKAKPVLASNVEFAINPAIIDAILALNVNTQYEELSCLGFNPDMDELMAVVKVKLSSGYSGSLCSSGSKEYVAFWVDWGSGWEYAGTTSVDVYDLMNIPSEGLHYAVFLPLNTIGRRQSCEKGAKTVRVRAILSWSAAPSNSDPNYVPHWGNKKETLIQIKPGITTTGYAPIIQSVGAMAVASINSSGLANGAPVGGGCLANDSPFGGAVKITGKVANPPDMLGGGASPIQYRVYVSDDNGISWQQLMNKFTIWYNDLNSGIWGPNTPYTQQLDADGWYWYMEDISGPNQRFMTENVLGIWNTTGQGKWKIKVEAKNPADVTNTIYTSNVVTVMLNNKAPKASITITSGGGACADFKIGEVISGLYSAFDTDYFGSLTLWVEPNFGKGRFTVPAGGSLTDPTLSRGYPTVPTTGESGKAWSLDTKDMPRCGYVVKISVRDRTIVSNSPCNNFYAGDVVGLCLREITDN